MIFIPDMTHILFVFLQPLLTNIDCIFGIPSKESHIIKKFFLPVVNPTEHFVRITWVLIFA